MLFSELADARPLMKLAHRIEKLEEGSDDPDRDDWLDERAEDHRRAFEKREDVLTVWDEWLPKSQILHAVRRVGK